MLQTLVNDLNEIDYGLKEMNEIDQGLKETQMKCDHPHKNINQCLADINCCVFNRYQPILTDIN